MKPSLKKQFMLEALSYNASLNEPLNLFYYSSSDYYSTINYILFRKENTTKHNEVKLNIEQNSYYASLVEKGIAHELSDKNNKKLNLDGDSDFMSGYFKHFFTAHPDLQLDLMKFFHGFLKYSTKPTEFLKQFDKKQIEPFLTQVNYWHSYSTENLKDLNTLMVDTNFSEGFRVSVIKKYVEHNLKVINKNPHYSKALEEFIDNEYPQYMDIIAPNVVAIQNRFKNINYDQYYSSFSEKPCIYQHVNIEKILKTFHVAGWATSSYLSLIQMYNHSLVEKKQFEIKEDIHQNHKNIQVYIKMPDNNFTLEHYQKDLLTLFEFYRNNASYQINLENINKVLFNKKMNLDLPSKDLSIKPKKI